MSFNELGFLSPELDEFYAQVRGFPGYKEWFDLAEDLNRLALATLSAVIPRSRDDGYVAALFVRALHSFEAGLLLARRLMVADTQAILRGMTEGVIAIHAMSKEPGFYDRLVEDHLSLQRKTARLTLNNRNLATSVQSFRESYVSSIQQADEYEKTLGQPLRQLKWEGVASTHCALLYDVIYRQASSGGAHTNPATIERHFVVDPSGVVTSVRSGPDTGELVATLRQLVVVMISACDVLSNHFNLATHQAKLGPLLERYGGLPKEEPHGAKVVPDPGFARHSSAPR